jgi:hypothetical protein
MPGKCLIGWKRCRSQPIPVTSMPASSDRRGRLLLATIAILLVAGYALTLWTFYPGVMTWDAKFVYQDIAKGFYGDWQSPVMTWLWGLIDPIAPGSGSMFILIATLYWLGFALPSFALALSGHRNALLLPFLALLPPAFVFVGTIWRDVLFSACWLVAAGVAFLAPARPSRVRLPAQLLALLLVVFGVLLRPNALLAAPLLAAYTIGPDRFSWRRTFLLYVPAAIAIFASVQLIYYGALGATRQNPLQAIMIFDLGGISHFAKENQYPVEWSEAQNSQLLDSCYKPTEWDIYWRLEPCQFVMQKVEREKGLFGTSAIPKAWLAAILRHPIAYLQHRSAFMWNFLGGGNNLTMWIADVDHSSERVFADRRIFAGLVSLHDLLKPTPLFRAGSWLLLCVALCWFGWRRGNTREGAFALGACGSAVIYVMSFYLVGVASDFRYAYWTVLTGLAGSVVVASRTTAASAELDREPAGRGSIASLPPVPKMRSRIYSRLRRRSAAF